MKKITLITGILFTVLVSIAQENFDGEIRWGEEIEMKKREKGPYPIGVADGSLYSTKIVKKDRYLQTLSLESLSIEDESEMNFMHNGFRLSSIGSFVFADRPIFMTTYVDKKAQERHYFIHELENNDLGTPIELATVPYMKTSGIGAKRKRKEAEKMGAFSFNRIVSEDYESLMISYQNDAGVTETVLYDKELAEVSRQEMEMPFDQLKMVTGRLSNTGRYYMIGYEFKTEKSTGLLKYDVETPTNYHLIIFDALNGEMETIPINIGKDIYSLSLKIFEDGSSVIYGMYSNDKAKGVTGAFFQKLDAKYSVEFTSLEEFEEDFITQFWSEWEKKRAEKAKKKKNPKKQQEPSLYSYIMHDLAIKDNGDMTLLAEQYYWYITTQTYTDANGNTRTTTTYHYHYNDVIAVNCTSKGDITWKQKVKKRQYSTNDGGYYSSFYTIVQENDIYLMYNDKEANMEDSDEAQTILEKRKQRRNTIAALITLSEDGDNNRKTLFDFEEDSSRRLVPKQCKKMSENEILLFTKAKKNSRILGWLTF